MKLLLDEHYSPEIAAQLRQQGHDAVAVVERTELWGFTDLELWELARRERRAVVTNNQRDFEPLFGADVRAGNESFGLLLTSDRPLPRRRDTIGLYVRVLDELLRDHPNEDALRNRLRWLP